MKLGFKLAERGTDVRTEILAGCTTFTTMSYILAVNPTILRDAGMDGGAVFTATALASALACLCMGLLANMPFALSAGMGLNAYFAYTVVLGMGYTWQEALAAVFIEGLIFILLSATKAREALFNAIPPVLKTAVSVGIGMYICLIGLKNAHVVVGSEATLVSLFSFRNSIAAGTFRSEGVSVILAMAGVLIITFMVIKKVKGGLLLGIFATWLLGCLCQLAGIYVPDPAAGFGSMFPSGIVSAPASIAPTFLKMDFGILRKPDFLTIMFAFLFVDMFDTLGEVIACATKANLLDEKGRLPAIREVLLSDAIGTTVGAVLGTSTVTTYLESTTGISEGGRTGLTAVSTGILFLAAIFFAPLFLAIPFCATAPAFVVVGFFMMQQVGEIDWNKDPAGALPAYITIIAMPLTYSVADGIALGIISYVVLHTVTGRQKEIPKLLYVLTAAFILKYIFL